MGLCGILAQYPGKIAAMPDAIKFRPNPTKIVEALVFLAGLQPRIDVFHVCKVLYFADRDHFRMYGRPILGDQYCALDDGPVPSLALNIAKRKKEFVPPAVLEHAERKLAVDETDAFVRLIAREPFDNALFSRTDIECLTSALKRFGEMKFMDLWKLGHRETAWRGYFKGKGTSTPIPFEALLPVGMKDREKAIEQIRETAAITAL